MLGWILGLDTRKRVDLDSIVAVEYKGVLALLLFLKMK